MHSSGQRLDRRGACQPLSHLRQPARLAWRSTPARPPAWLDANVEYQRGSATCPHQRPGRQARTRSRPHTTPTKPEGGPSPEQAPSDQGHAHEVISETADLLRDNGSSMLTDGCPRSPATSRPSAAAWTSWRRTPAGTHSRWPSCRHADAGLRAQDHDLDRTPRPIDLDACCCQASSWGWLVGRGVSHREAEIHGVRRSAKQHARAKRPPVHSYKVNWVQRDPASDDDARNSIVGKTRMDLRGHSWTRTGCQVGV